MPKSSSRRLSEVETLHLRPRQRRAIVSEEIQAFFFGILWTLITTFINWVVRDEQTSWKNLRSCRECVFDFHRHSNYWWIDDTRSRWTAVPTYWSALICLPNQQSLLIDRVDARIEGNCRRVKEIIAMVELSLKATNGIGIFVRSRFCRKY